MRTRNGLPPNLDLPARLSKRLRPGVALVPWGWWGEDRAANVLTSDRPTDWGDGVAYLDTRVEVESLEPNAAFSTQ